MAYSKFIAQVPQYNANGSIDPTALGIITDILGSGGWLSNKGTDTIYLVRIGDNLAKQDPINRGQKIDSGNSLPLPAGINLSQFGVLSDGSGGVASVLGA